MHRLGMKNIGKNFMHPRVPAESPLREHVVFRIDAQEFDTEMPVEIVAA